LCQLLYLQQQKESISHISFHSGKYKEQLFSTKAATTLNKFANRAKRKRWFWITEQF